MYKLPTDFGENIHAALRLGTVREPRGFLLSLIPLKHLGEAVFTITIGNTFPLAALTSEAKVIPCFGLFPTLQCILQSARVLSRRVQKEHEVSSVFQISSGAYPQTTVGSFSINTWTVCSHTINCLPNHHKLFCRVAA